VPGRKFLLRYRHDAHKPIRERRNAAFFRASLAMHSHPPKRIRWALALALGLPGTAVYLPLTAFVAFLAVGSPNFLQQGILYFSWGIAGIIGLIGFWIWVFQPRWLNRPIGKWIVVGMLGAGITAMTPIAAALIAWPPQVSVWSALAVLGILAGLFVLYHQLRAVTGAD
jgi:hypothetical protein